jgi:hypothetical protein
MKIKSSDLVIGDIVADTNRIGLQTIFRVANIDDDFLYMERISGANHYRLSDNKYILFSRNGSDWVLIEKSTPINPKKDLKAFNF